MLRLQLSLWPHQRQSVHTSTSFPPSFLTILALRCYSYRLLLLIRSLLITAPIFPRGYRSSVLGTPYDNHPFAAHNSTASPSIQTTYSLRLFSLPYRLGHLFGSVVTLRFTCLLFQCRMLLSERCRLMYTCTLFLSLWLTFDSHFHFHSHIIEMRAWMSLHCCYYWSIASRALYSALAPELPTK